MSMSLQFFRAHGKHTVLGIGESYVLLVRVSTGLYIAAASIAITKQHDPQETPAAECAIRFRRVRARLL